MAVIQFQNKVFFLQKKNMKLRKRIKENKKKFSYYIQTPFDGTFTGSGATAAEAKANTLQACEKSSGSTFFCKEINLKSK